MGGQQSPACWGFCASTTWRASVCRARSASSWSGSRSACRSPRGSSRPWAWGELFIGAIVPHASALKHMSGLAGRALPRQLGNALAKARITVQESLLGAAPGGRCRPPGVCGLIHAARTQMTGDFRAHHRGSTPNPASDTHLGRVRLQPHHNRRASPSTQRPATTHNSTTATRNCLHPMTPPIDGCIYVVLTEEGVHTKGLGGRPWCSTGGPQGRLKG